jgi:hypothetical protein
MIRSRLLFLALLLSPLASMAPAHAHGSHGGGSELEAGEFDFTPLITVEGHAGYENNLRSPARHFAGDFLIGAEWAWGLGNDQQISLSAFVGPALVHGGAEHFYGEIHVEEGEVHEEAHPARSRVDFKGLFEANYKYSDSLSFQAFWNPYVVTSDEVQIEDGETETFETKGVKNEVGIKAKYAFGDGDVDFGLGDSFADLIDGLYISVDHRQGWGADGVHIGNYTDPRLGVAFNYGETAFQVDLGPRFYTPGSYASGLINSRTDLAGEIMISKPVSEKMDFFAHWKFVGTWDNSAGVGGGLQHHVGTGITYKL